MTEYRSRFRVPRSGFVFCVRVLRSGSGFGVHGAEFEARAPDARNPERRTV